VIEESGNLAIETFLGRSDRRLNYKITRLPNYKFPQELPLPSPPAILISVRPLQRGPSNSERDEGGLSSAVARTNTGLKRPVHQANQVCWSPG
jgi:hypothetical protein